METAHDIYQRHIDEVSKAVFDGDIDSVIARWGIPHVFISHGGEEIVKGEEMLRRYMTNFHRHIRSIGATAYHRICLEAHFAPEDADRIEGRHRTYLLRGGSYVIDPYESDMVFERQNGVWRAILSRIPISIRQINPLRAAATDRADDVDTPLERRTGKS